MNLLSDLYKFGLIEYYKDIGDSLSAKDAYDTLTEGLDIVIDKILEKLK